MARFRIIRSSLTELRRKSNHDDVIWGFIQSVKLDDLGAFTVSTAIDDRTLKLLCFGVGRHSISVVPRFKEQKHDHIIRSSLTELRRKSNHDDVIWGFIQSVKLDDLGAFTVSTAIDDRTLKLLCFGVGRHSISVVPRFKEQKHDHIIRSSLTELRRKSNHDDVIWGFIQSVKLDDLGAFTVSTAIDDRTLKLLCFGVGRHSISVVPRFKEQKHDQLALIVYLNIQNLKSLCKI
ncbi:hypothetical protein CDAR_316711 [Caerostris darwini]|uniref:Ribosomal protein S1 n=1 Tax=Caerostris darwini TaxID=1538125 RepID=A0AAV4MIM0_9ARAC|nr:hypothetical protein CDAR_316711 [Caerostris darwini]